MPGNRAIRTLVAVVSALVLTVSVTGWAASTKYLSGISQVNVFGGLGASRIWTGGPTNILVVGSDDRSGLSRKQRHELSAGQDDYGRHTDTMMLVHLSADLGAVTVVSIPRDSLVTIPAHTDAAGTAVPEQPGKINAAFASGGPALTVQTVERATGVAIDHYVEVNFAGFLSMVDAVGGVEVCLETPLQDTLSGLNLPAGRQTISGPQALAYVRARYIDNDFGRSNRQQKFLAAMVQKVFSAGTLLNPVALNGFIDAAMSSVTTDERLDADTIAALAGRAGSLDLGNIRFTTVPVSDGDHLAAGQSTVLWDAEAATALFDALRDDEPLPEPPKTVPVEVPADDISITLTAPGPNGAAAVEDFTRAGYQVTLTQPVSSAAPASPSASSPPSAPVASGSPSASAPAPSSAAPAAPAATTVRYDPAYPKSLATLRVALPDAVFTEAPGIGESFQVVVGSDFAGLIPVRAAATSVAHTVRSAKDSICDTPTG